MQAIHDVLFATYRGVVTYKPSWTIGYWLRIHPIEYSTSEASNEKWFSPAPLCGSRLNTYRIRKLLYSAKDTDRYYFSCPQLSRIRICELCGPQDLSFVRHSLLGLVSVT